MTTGLTWSLETVVLEEAPPTGFLLALFNGAPPVRKEIPIPTAAVLAVFPLVPDGTPAEGWVTQTGIASFARLVPAASGPYGPALLQCLVGGPQPSSGMLALPSRSLMIGQRLTIALTIAPHVLADWQRYAG